MVWLNLVIPPPRTNTSDQKLIPTIPESRGCWYRSFNTDLDPGLAWWNPPPHWHIDRTARVLVVEPAAETDFWQRTHYGFRNDSGHFLHLEAAGLLLRAGTDVTVE
jgi:hypothetical protein